MKWDDWRPRSRGLSKAFDCWRAGNLSQALALFEAGVLKRPEEADAWRGLGSVFWSLDRFEESAEAFRKALDLDCWNPMHWHNLGLAYRHLNKPVQARNLLQAATALDPTYEPAFNELANVLVDEGRPGEALAIYDHALSLDNSRAVVHHNRGVCLRLLGDYPAAVASFLAALRMEPDYHHTLLELQGHWAAPFVALEELQVRSGRGGSRQRRRRATRVAST